MEEFDELLSLVKKSRKLDPWVVKRGAFGYCEELKLETDEVMQAVEKKDIRNLKEELGDVMLDWVHACNNAENENMFTLKEVLEGIIGKVNRRKPYLKENRKVPYHEARRLWKEAKDKEKITL